MKLLLTLLLLGFIFFLAAQNVGIGTTTPTERLEVNGTIKTNRLEIIQANDSN